MTTAFSSPPATLDRSTFLRRVLLVDAATCIATGALMSVAASPLAGPLALPAELLFFSGLSLFPIAALMIWIATRRAVSRAGTWFVLIGNAGWVIGSVLVLIWLLPTALGLAFIIAQAVVVALLAELEYTGLRRIG